MLTFKQYINEAFWNKLIYHASYDKFDPKKVKPGSHFGSLRAAMGRATSTKGETHHKPGTWSKNKKGQDEYKSNPPRKNNRRTLKVHAYAYRPTGKSLRVRDTPPNKGDWWNSNSVGTQKRGKQDIDEPYTKKLNARGITHLKYKNRWEDPGSEGHQIWDTQNLRHIKTFKSPKFINREYSKKLAVDVTGQTLYDTDHNRKKK